MHRLLVIAAAGLAALVSTGSAMAWSWPADGDVLRSFALAGDAYAAGQHRGVDVAGQEGSPVRAPATGTVSFAGSLPSYGRGVTIRTPDGYAVTLVHLGSIGVTKGDVVAEGAPIGTMGWSGDAEHAVPTVHLGVRVGAEAEDYLDPLGLLPPRPAPSTPAPQAQGQARAAGSASVPSAAPAAALPPAPPAAPPPAPAAVSATASAAAPPPTAAAAAAPAPPSVASAAPVPPPPGRTSTAPVAAAPQASAVQLTPPVPETTGAAPEAGAGEASVARGVAVTAAAPAGSGSGRPFRVEPGQGTFPATARAVVSRSGDRRHAAGQSVSVAAPKRFADAAATAGRPMAAASVVPAEIETRASGHLVRSMRAAHAVGSSTRVASDPTPGRAVVRAVPQADLRVASGRETSPAREPTSVPTEPSGHGAVPLGVLLAAALLVLLAVTAVARATRRIGGNGAVLRHHADLLRQLHAAHRSRLHDRGGRHRGAASEAARP